MKMSCILEALKERKYIKMEEYYPPSNIKSFNVYGIQSLVGKKFEKKLISTIKEDDEYIYCSDKHIHIIAKKEEINRWMEDILFEEEVDVRFGFSITSQLANYIESQGYSLSPECYDWGSYKIINKDVYQKRLTKEKETEEKALKFLKCLNGGVY